MNESHYFEYLHELRVYFVVYMSSLPFYEWNWCNRAEFTEVGNLLNLAMASAHMI